MVLAKRARNQKVFGKQVYKGPSMKQIGSFFSALAVVTALGLAATRPVIAQNYTVTDLGALPGKISSTVNLGGLNASGQVSGTSYLNDDVDNHAFRWTPTVPNGTTGAMIDLGALIVGGRSAGTGINVSGQVVGVSDGPGGTRGFLFSNGTMYDIGELGPGTRTVANGINDRGQISGNSEIPGVGRHTFLWTPNTPNGVIGTMTDLGIDGQFGGAAINGFGQVVGQADTVNGLGSLWTPNSPNGTTGTTIFFNPLSGDLYTNANGINGRGQVVGGSVTLSESRAFLWTPTTPNGTIGSMIDLGTLGDPVSVAGGINSSAYVVGLSRIGGVDHAFIWDTANGMRDLNSLIPPGTGWVLRQGRAINEFGQIVGRGTNPNGEERAFLLTPSGPPPPPPPLLIAVTPSTVDAGQSANGTVTLGSSASTGGALVNLTSSDPAAIVPASVMIPEGSISAAFTVATAEPANGATTATITATYNSSLATATLTILPLIESLLLFQPPIGPWLPMVDVVGSQQTYGMITLVRPAQRDTVVELISEDPKVASVTPSITIQEGRRSATFYIFTMPVAVTRPVQIAAGLLGSRAFATLIVHTPVPTSLSICPQTVIGGSPATGTVTISGPAPPEGLNVSLSSGNPAAIVPTSFTIQPGKTYGSFQIQTISVGSSQTASITATYEGAAASALLRISSLMVSSVALAPASVTGGGVSKCTVALTGPAPPGGASVVLSNSNPSAATVPSSVVVPGGSNSVTFNVTTRAVSADTSAMVTATYGGASKGATLAIKAASLSSVTLTPTVIHGGTTATGRVFLTGPAPTGGANVSLNATPGGSIPPSVLIPTGQSSGQFTFRANQVTQNVTVKVTATYGNSKTAAILVTP